MSLYIKVYLSFWTHRKTGRLVGLLGNSALWIMPKLWSYAATSQRDGSFATYTDADFAFALGLGEVSAESVQKIRKAIVESGYMDPDGKLHNWDTWNGYHQMEHERAQKAANARWFRKAKEPVGQTSLPIDLPPKPVTEPELVVKRPARTVPRLTPVQESISKLAFARFWEAYPRKTGKGAAESEWLKINPNLELQEAIQAAISAQKESPDWIKENGEYIPHPRTWLHQKRWQDTPRTAPAGAAGAPAAIRTVSEAESVIKECNARIEEINRKTESWMYTGGIRGALKPEAIEEVRRLKEKIGQMRNFKTA